LDKGTDEGFAPLRPGDIELAERLTVGLRNFEAENGGLPGIRVAGHREVFIEQLVESIRRVKYVHALRLRDVSPLISDPHNESFNPIRAALYFKRQGDWDEAFWMVFLFIHFGQYKGQYNYIREIYGQFDGTDRWSWLNVSSNMEAFKLWLQENEERLISGDSPRGFGAHRRYETLRSASDKWTGIIVESYVNWVDPTRTHLELFESFNIVAENPAESRFYSAYNSLNSVLRFGRVAKFDYLTMVGKLGLFELIPGIAYLAGSTGPLKGAKLLVGGSRRFRIPIKTLEQNLKLLDDELNVGKQVLEDAICNWQKNPENFIGFRG